MQTPVVSKFTKICILFISVMFNYCSNDSGVNNIDEPIEFEHFKFHIYGEIDDNTINLIKERLESNYSRVVDDLKATLTKTIDVKIWQTETQFLTDMEKDLGIRYQGATGYLGGIRDIRILNTNDPAQIALHEFVHSVSLHINSSFSNNPRWLWEAVAIYESGEFIHPNRLSYMISGNYPTITELTEDYNNSNYKIYSVGYILLEFIIDKWGMDSVIDLIKSNGNLQSNLGLTIYEFEEQWHQFIKSKYFAD